MHGQELIARLYQRMALIRRFELRLAEVYHTDVIKSPVHLSVGQEAVAVAVCDPLREDDILSNTYRCHATYIAKGGDLNQMMAELYGKASGCAGGKAGSMHLIHMPKGILGASAVVGTTIPVATGYAMALKMQQSSRIVTCVFGDGATEEGCFYESVNFAALRQLPILYVCENNRLAIHAPLEKRWATQQLCQRVATFGIKTFQIHDTDIFTLRDTVIEAITYVRDTGTPAFIECFTYRWLEHVGPRDDHDDTYRDLNEYRHWKKHDQVERLGAMLDTQTRQRIDDEISQAILAAENFAASSPYPTDEELYQHVYAS
jgi:pyruvate dehydrogenase E1 component alpha subunit